jgi:hypothetical protein
VSPAVTATPHWDARDRLAHLAGRSRPASGIEVVATADPELFRFHTGDGRVEGFARVVEVDLVSQRSVIAVTGGTPTSPGSASIRLLDHAAELVSDGRAAADAPLDPVITAAWLEALTPPVVDTGASEPDLGDPRVRFATVSGVVALALAAIAWWWRSAGSARARAGG